MRSSLSPPSAANITLFAAPLLPPPSSSSLLLLSPPSPPPSSSSLSPPLSADLGPPSGSGTKGANSCRESTDRHSPISALFCVEDMIGGRKTPYLEGGGFRPLVLCSPRRLGDDAAGPWWWRSSPPAPAPGWLAKNRSMISPFPEKGGTDASSASRSFGAEEKTSRGASRRRAEAKKSTGGWC